MCYCIDAAIHLDLVGLLQSECHEFLMIKYKVLVLLGSDFKHFCTRVTRFSHKSCAGKQLKSTYALNRCDSSCGYLGIDLR